MKLKCVPSPSERARRRREWHDWFAWYPVRVEEGDCRWLETVQRRKVSFVYDYDYDFVSYNYYYRAKP